MSLEKVRVFQLDTFLLRLKWVKGHLLMESVPAEVEEIRRQLIDLLSGKCRADLMFIWQKLMPYDHSRWDLRSSTNDELRTCLARIFLFGTHRCQDDGQPFYNQGVLSSSYCSDTNCDKAS